jgi:hypothetical protein
MLLTKHGGATSFATFKVVDPSGQWAFRRHQQVARIDAHLSMKPGYELIAAEAFGDATFTQPMKFQIGAELRQPG